MKTTALLAPFAAALAALLPACQLDADAADATGPDPDPATTTVADRASVLARGEYLIRTTGCNDCHTAGYADAQGNLDQAQWLTGSPVGFKGPWGTTYPSNLRLKLAAMDESQWLEYSGTLITRPLMPDFALRAMSVDDRRAMFRFIKSLGPGGQPAPTYLPPGQQPQPPYFELVLPTPTATPAVAGGS